MNLLIFAGTTEGRMLSEQLASLGISVSVSVATEYGKQLLPKSDNISVLSGRMTQEQMEQTIKTNHFDCVVDATHPYAVEVTQNIKQACAQQKVTYLRLRRKSELWEDGIVVNSAKQAAEYLNQVTGIILLTTGSKELPVFTTITDYQQRCYARVLPLAQVVQQCQDLGFSGNHIIAMQGPFSEDFNYAMLKQINAAYLVTKESGKAGGFSEKMRAAQRAGTKVIVIARPNEDGLDYDTILKQLTER